MPVIVHPSSHNASTYQAGPPATNARDLLFNSLTWPIPDDLDLYQSSFGHGAAKLNQPIVPTTNGFVNSLVHAYNQHHHLIIRPEDIWFAILTQLSLYVNAHAEELRGKFVPFEGKKEIRLEYNPFSRYEFDFSIFASDVYKVLSHVVVDPALGTWLMPDFTTTTDNDKVVASVIMMGTLQKYFEYTCGEICGFPSVELLGEKSDYEAILAKIDKLEEYGDEPKQFASLLRPVLSRFVQTFDAPESDEVVRFWRRVLDDDDSLCGVSWYTGWITAFCFWGEDGGSLYNQRESHGMDDIMDPDNSRIDTEILETRCLVLDGVRYHGIDAKDIPPAWVKVPVNVEQNGAIVKAEMFAGVFGIGLSSKNGSLAKATGMQTDFDFRSMDSMAPVAAWWITEEMGPKCNAHKEKLEEKRLRYLKELMRDE